MQNGSALTMDQYMANYGERLQSLLAGGTMTTNPGAVGAPGSAQPQGGVAPAAGPQRPPGPAQPPAEGAGTSFQDKWNESSAEEQRKFTDDLEKQLQQGNQTIDTAYDDLVKQMGVRPGPDEKLSREEKGMFLMEFGLSLMANSSSRGGFDGDTAGAVGASGLSALQGHRARRGRERERYDENRLDIEKGRAGAKSRLAEQSALEARSEARDRRREQREDSQLAGVITQPDDTVVGYTRGGQVSELQRPGGGAVKAKPRPVSASGGGGRTLESDRRYQLYLESYGKDADGKPLTGPQLEEVKKRALAFSVDPKGSTTSDSEMRTMAERSADAFMKSNWSMFRDMKPDEAKKWREDYATDNVKRLKEGRDLDMQLPKPAPAARASKSALGAAAKTPKPYASIDAVKADIRAKKLKSGDVVIVNNKRFAVP